MVQFRSPHLTQSTLLVPSMSELAVPKFTFSQQGQLYLVRHLPPDKMYCNLSVVLLSPPWHWTASLAVDIFYNKLPKWNGCISFLMSR